MHMIMKRKAAKSTGDSVIRLPFRWGPRDFPLLWLNIVRLVLKARFIRNGPFFVLFDGGYIGYRRNVVGGMPTRFVKAYSNALIF